MSSKRSAVIRRASEAVVEGLEDRRLLSATLTVVNPLGIPSSNRFIFNVVQNPNPSVPNAVHATNTIALKNTGDAPLTINSLTLSGPFTLVSGPAAGSNIPAGQSVNAVVQFTQQTLPAHSVNETNYTTDPNGGAAINGSLTISSNSATNPSQSVTLSGYWQNQSENNDEPNLTTIVNKVAGYSTTIASNPNQVDLTEPSSSAQYYGDEVASDYWTQANPAQNVGITELATWHTQGNVVHTYWYSQATQASNLLLTSQGNQGQTLLPTMANGNPQATSFNPGGAFGIRVDNEYSTDSINVAKNNGKSGGHHVRFYPLIDANGNAVANTYIVAMDYAVIQTENYDFQDNVYIVSNIMPSSAPSAPTNFTATSAANPSLTWTGVNSPNLAGYDVARSTTAGGAYTQLNSSPITTTNFTDSTAPANTELYYRLTSVDTSGNQSAPATATANTPAGPVAVADAFSVNSGAATPLNVLANDTDGSGAALNANSVTIVSAPGHGSAVVDSAGGTGTITYTSTVGYTGNDTLTYTVTDANGVTSTPGTVTLTVGTTSTGIATAENDIGYALSGQTSHLSVLSNDTSPSGTFDNGTLTVTSAPSHGAAVPNASGQIDYQATAGFVGQDTFNYSIDGSNSARVTVYVGTTVGTGSTKYITYKDSSGTDGKITLNHGVANVYFAGSGTVNTSKNIGTVTGSNLTIANIDLSGTNGSSKLMLKSAGNQGTLNLGGITDSGTLRAVIAPSTVLTGITDANNTVVIGGLSQLTLKSANTASINVGNTGVSGFTFVASGDVTNSNLNSGVAIRQLKAASWTNTANNVLIVSAPAINNLVVAGSFDPNLDLSGTGSSAPSLRHASIVGAVEIGYWNISGSAQNVIVGSASSSWGAAVTGALNHLVIHGGGLAATVNAGTLGNIAISGDLTGTITAGSARVIRVNGGVSNSTLTLTNSSGTVLNNLKVTGAISNSTVAAAGNIRNINANALTNSVIDAGPDASLSLADASTANIGSESINNIRLSGRAATAFSNSTILASSLGAVNLGSVNVSNNNVPLGIGADNIRNVHLSIGVKKANFNSRDLASQDTVNAAIAASGVSFGDLEIRVLG